MGTVCFYKAHACVSTYQTSWCHIPEERNAPCHHHENLKSHNYFISCLLTSQCVSSAHSICTPYSTESGMNATWQSILSIQVFYGVTMCHHTGGADFWRHQQTQWHYLPLTCQELHAQRHSITSQTAWILSKNAVRTSHLDIFISVSCVTLCALETSNVTAKQISSKNYSCHITQWTVVTSLTALLDNLPVPSPFLDPSSWDQ